MLSTVNTLEAQPRHIMQTASSGDPAVTVKVVSSAIEFMLAAQGDEPANIVLQDHISFRKEFQDIGLGLQEQDSAVDIAITDTVRSIRVRAFWSNLNTSTQPFSTTHRGL